MDDLTDSFIDVWARSEGELTDHFGNFFPIVCPRCGGQMEILKPGVAVCVQVGCDYVAHGQGGIKEL